MGHPSAIRPTRAGRHACAPGRLAFVSVVIAILVGAGSGEARGHHPSALLPRRLQASNATSAANSTVTASPANVTSAIANGTATAVNGTVTAVPPPLPPSSPPPAKETAKDKIEEKWEKLESQRTPAEKGVAITIGVIMLVSILTCLACCVFRRGGQWRIPGLQWFKRKFGSKERYSRYQDNDDGF